MSGFSITRAWQLLGYSQAAYDRPNVTTELAHALVEDAGDFIVLAYRGTHEVKDALSDVECWLNRGMHAGFLRAYDQSIAPVMAALARLAPKPLIVTGHSLGGAMAALFCLHNPARFAECYTFGQPRIGDHFTARLMDVLVGDRLLRVRDALDIVPHMPLPPLFRHGGVDCYMDWGGKVHLNPSWMRKGLSDGIGLWRAWRKNWEEPLEDHFLTSYSTRMRPSLPVAVEKIVETATATPT